MIKVLCALAVAVGDSITRVCVGEIPPLSFYVGRFYPPHRRSLYAQPGGSYGKNNKYGEERDVRACVRVCDGTYRLSEELTLSLTMMTCTAMLLCKFSMLLVMRHDILMCLNVMHHTHILQYYTGDAIATLQARAAYFN